MKKNSIIYNRLTCKKAAFLHKKAAFLHEKAAFLHEKAAFLQKYIFVKK